MGIGAPPEIEPVQTNSLTGPANDGAPPKLFALACRLVAEHVFVEFTFPFCNGRGDGSVTSDVCHGAHHVEQAVKREDHGDDQKRLFLTHADG